MLFHVQDVDNYIHIRDLIRAQICNCFHLIKWQLHLIILWKYLHGMIVHCNLHFILSAIKKNAKSYLHSEK